MTNEIMQCSSSILGCAVLAENVATFGSLCIVEKNITHPMTLVAKRLDLVCWWVAVEIHDLPNVCALRSCFKCLNEGRELGFISELGE